jgi:ABC-type glycerol-3-phosphate transport system substrate-binding protein
VGAKDRQHARVHRSATRLHCDALRVSELLEGRKRGRRCVHIDVTWLGIAAPHSTDLKEYFREDEISEHFPRIIQNNTVNGRLVGMPFFADAGLLHYRTDLLEKYNFKEPPKTWRELAQMAKKIQDGQRQGGKRDFQGFGGRESARNAVRQIEQAAQSMVR